MKRENYILLQVVVELIRNEKLPFNLSLDEERGVVSATYPNSVYVDGLVFTPSDKFVNAAKESAKNLGATLMFNNNRNSFWIDSLK